MAAAPGPLNSNPCGFLSLQQSLCSLASAYIRLTVKSSDPDNDSQIELLLLESKSDVQRAGEIYARELGNEGHGQTAKALITKKIELITSIGSVYSDPQIFLDRATNKIQIAALRASELSRTIKRAQKLEEITLSEMADILSLPGDAQPKIEMTMHLWKGLLFVKEKARDQGDILQKIAEVLLDAASRQAPPESLLDRVTLLQGQFIDAPTASTINPFVVKKTFIAIGDAVAELSALYLAQQEGEATEIAETASLSVQMRTVHQANNAIRRFLGEIHSNIDRAKIEGLLKLNTLKACCSAIQEIMNLPEIFSRIDQPAVCGMIDAARIVKNEVRSKALRASYRLQEVGAVQNIVLERLAKETLSYGDPVGSHLMKMSERLKDGLRFYFLQMEERHGRGDEVLAKKVWGNFKNDESLEARANSILHASEADISDLVQDAMVELEEAIKNFDAMP